MSGLGLKRGGLKPSSFRGIKRKGGGVRRIHTPKPKAPKKAKSKNAKLRELKEAWCIPTTNNFELRYTGIRGVYWYWLSRQIRKDEWEKYGGKCLTCLVPLETWEEGQCGHVVPSSVCGEYLRLNKINLTLQHSKCNNPRFRPDAPALNAIHYDLRHGTGRWQELYNMRKLEAKHPTQEKYRQLIKALPSYQKAAAQSLQQ